ncbi:MAG: hypothetical protein WBA74_28085, partial [Cyclobacteriaceae bacterium]
MNKITINLMIILSLISVSGMAQNTASDHMTALNSSYSQIQRDTWDYIKKASRGRNAGKIEKRRMELLATLRTSKLSAMKVKPFAGDKSLRDAVVSYLDMSIHIMNEDFQEIVNLEKIAEDSYDFMEAYILLKEQVNQKMDSSSRALSNVKEQFAANNNIRLIAAEETKLSQKIDNASAVNAYYNKLYLIFFKSYWYEQEMIAALSEGRAGDAEQFR